MKKTIIVTILCFAMVVAPTQKSHAIVWAVVKAAIKKVIMAIDLQIQRQQNKVIWLQNAQKTLENTMSKLKLKEISNWTQKQKDLYADYFEELRKVKALISYYQRIRDINEKQAKIVANYNRTWAIVRSDKHFTVKEISYMGDVYSGILAETVRNIDQLMLVVNSFKTQMTDAKRLEIIKTVEDKVDGNYRDLMIFNQQNAALSIQRASGQNETEMVKKLYGIQY